MNASSVWDDIPPQEPPCEVDPWTETPTTEEWAQPPMAAPAGTFRRAHVTWADQITMRRVVWAWADNGQGRIPSGSLSIAAGREATGKSSFGIWLAAQITRGTLPGSLHGQCRRVLYVAVEDSWEHTLAPRLAAAGADLALVGRFDVLRTGSEDALVMSLPIDNELLEAMVKEHDVALVVMDPLMSLMGSTIRTNDTRSVREALDPLQAIAIRTSCLMLGIAHFNKASGTDPSSLITGSGAFKDVPRSVFGFVKDSDADDGTRVMTQVKNSLGREELPSLKYVIEDAEVQTPDGPTHVGRFCWTGTSDRTAQDILRDASGPPEDREERDDAAAWLRSHLMDHGGEARTTDILAAGRAGGYSKDSLKKAKGRAGVESHKIAMGGGWLWRLKNDGHGAPESPEGSEGSQGSLSQKDAPFAPFALPSGLESSNGPGVSTGPDGW